MESSIPKPDLLVYLYLDVEHLQTNIKKRGRNYEQDIKKEYLDKIQDSYFDYIKHIQDFPVLMIDTNKIDFVKNEGDYEKLKKVIFDKYENGLQIIEL